VGSVPVSEFEYRYSIVKPVAPEIEAGIVDASLLLFNNKLLRLFKFPNESGSVPTRLKDARLSLVIVVEVGDAEQVTPAQGVGVHGSAPGAKLHFGVPLLYVHPAPFVAV